MIGVRIDVIAEKIFRIAGEIGVAIKGIFRTAKITDATTETASGAAVVSETITEEISGVIGDSGEIIKRISEPIVKRKGITNDIIPHGQIIASDILPSDTGISIQPDSTEEDAGVSLKDVRFLSVKISGNLTQGREGQGLICNQKITEQALTPIFLIIGCRGDLAMVIQS